jgi:hypothetical protein
VFALMDVEDIDKYMFGEEYSKLHDPLKVAEN